MLWHVFKWLLFPPPPAGSMRGLFSDIHCENLVELLEVKLTKVWDHPHPMSGSPLKFLTLKLVHTELPVGIL